MRIDIPETFSCLSDFRRFLNSFDCTLRKISRKICKKKIKEKLVSLKSIIFFKLRFSAARCASYSHNPQSTLHKIHQRLLNFIITFSHLTKKSSNAKISTSKKVYADERQMKRTAMK